MKKQNPGDLPLPLAGIKVLELARVASGPYTGLLLADLGAEVIKVEPPGGDDSRRSDVGHDHGISGYHFGLNRGKRSVVSDLKTPAGVDLVRHLASQSDVLIENYRPGTAERLGIGYSALSRANPRLVYCSISSFGAQGPLKGRAGYDLIAQAVIGMMSITGEEDGPAAKCGPPAVDIVCGTLAAYGIMAALFQREISGQGQLVETSLIGGGLTMLTPYLPSRGLGTTFKRLGSAHNTLAPYQGFKGSDGREFVLGCANDTFWQRCVRAIGRIDLAVNQDYSTNAKRIQRRTALEATLQETFSTRPAEEWVRLLEAEDVPIALIYELDDVIREPQYRANGYVREVVDPVLGPIPVICTPLRFSKVRGGVGNMSPAQGLDEDGAQVRAGDSFRVSTQPLH